MQSLHPLPHTNPLNSAAGEQVPSEKGRCNEQANVSTSSLIPALGSEVLVKWKCVTDKRTKGPEQGPVHIEQGCAAVNGGGGRDQISAQNFQQRTAQVRK